LDREKLKKFPDNIFSKIISAYTRFLGGREAETATLLPKLSFNVCCRGGEKQTKQTVNKKELSPKQSELAHKKEAFLEALKTNGGNVSKALDASGLQRRSAYNHFNQDEDFRDAWQDAVEFGYDELSDEARRRAKDGVEKEIYNNKGEYLYTVREHSDTLLIF